MAVALRARNAVKVEDGIDTSNIIEEVDDNTKGTRSRLRGGEEEEETKKRNTAKKRHTMSLTTMVH